MKKFTAFTVILTGIVMIVAGEMVVDQYFGDSSASVTDSDGDFVFSLPTDLDLSEALETDVLGAGSVGNGDADSSNGASNSGLTNRLGSDIDYSASDYIYEEVGLSDEWTSLPETSLPEASDPVVLGEEPVDPVFEASSSDLPDFENEGDSGNYSANVYLRQEQIDSAGFVNAYIEKEPHNGLLYKTIYVDDLYDVEMMKYVVKTDTSLLVKVYVMEIGPKSSASEVFEVLKVRASEGLDIETNETNDFGDNSFYMNDARRSSTAFLTVRFGHLIYGFSYPKDFHVQVKNLITLIDMEF